PFKVLRIVGWRASSTCCPFTDRHWPSEWILPHSPRQSQRGLSNDVSELTVELRVRFCRCPRMPFLPLCALDSEVCPDHLAHLMGRGAGGEGINQPRNGAVLEPLAADTETAKHPLQRRF